MTRKKTQLRIVYLGIVLVSLMSLKIAYDYTSTRHGILTERVNTATNRDIHIADKVVHAAITMHPIKSRTNITGHDSSVIEPDDSFVIGLDASSVIGPDCSQPTSRHVLKHYPQNGTGATVDISGDFNFRTFNSFCVRYPNIEAIIPIYSAGANFERRIAIRETVGRECLKYNCKLFFIIGVSCNKTVYWKVKEEYEDKGDILMINKIDSYWDLNNKAVAMLAFLIKFCPHPKYVIHIVDDTYPNIELYLGQLHSLNVSNFILGHQLEHFRPRRNPKVKGFVSMEEYPQRFYPKYVMGMAYAFLNNDSAVLLDKAYSAPYIWIEDVWFTGFVRETASFEAIRPIKRHISGWAANTTNLWQKVSCVHPVSVREFYQIYKQHSQH